MIVVGFTGTRRGMIDPQRAAFRKLLREETSCSEFHHGDCTGADEQAHDDVRDTNDCFRYPDLLRILIHVHPPINPKNRAWKKGDVLYPEKEYLDRNRDIVDACDVLIATPKMLSEEFRGSGTWHAIRHAARAKKRTIIIWPTGAIQDFEQGWVTK